MMFLIRFSLSAISILSGALLPLAAHAYLTPEDVLDEDQYTTRYYDPPPSRRAIDDYVQAQQDRSAARREAEQAAIKPQPEPEEDLHGSAPDGFTDNDFERLIEAIEALQNGDTETNNGTTTNSQTDTTGGSPDSEDLQDRSTERALERLRDQQRRDQQAAYTQWLAAQGYTETLHSGAPLSDTGPGTIAAAIVMIGAGTWTIRRVMKQKVVGMSE